MIFAKISRTLFLSASTLSIGCATIHGAFAEEFVVNSATAIQNGGNVLSNGDTLKITTTGSINTVGGIDAVNTDGFNNSSIINDGGLSAVGDQGSGIVVRSRSSIINGGNIVTDGVNGDGIRAENRNAIENSGSIRTAGRQAQGVDVNNRNAVVNSGSIFTIGNRADGIRGGNRNALENSGLITTSGRFSEGFDVNNTNTVVNSGSIVTSGNRADGIQGGNRNALENSGSIATSGRAAEAFEFGNRNTVVNSGSVVTSGNLADVFVGGNRNTIVNSGSIATSGRFAEGFEVGNRNTINNSGSITTTGFGGDGIDADNRNIEVTNSGSIRTEGVEADGLQVRNRNQNVNNTGSITTTGNRSFGIRMQRLNIVNSSGSIETFGRRAPGIVTLRPDNTVNVSGKVVAAHTTSASFRFRNGNTLNLFAPAFLGGNIDIGNSDVSITTGASHSVLWEFDAPVTPDVSGPAIWAYNAATRQFATFDPTVFGAAGDILADTTGVLSQVTQGRLNSAPAGAPGAAEFGYLNKDGSGSPTNVWVQGIGLTSSYGADGILTDYDFDLVGVAAGFDGIYADGLTLGVLGGYYHGNLDSNSAFTSSYNNDTENWFAGVYGRKTIDKHFIDFGLNGGFQNVDQSRFVNDNLALTNGQTLGNAWANSSYDSWFINPEIAVGTEVHQHDGWSIVPTARARYAIQFIDGYSETGSNANAIVGSQQVQIAEGRLELAASKGFQTGHARVYGGYLARGSFGDDAVGVNLVGQNILVPTGEDTFQSVGYLGSQMVFNITSGLGLQVGSQFAFGSDFTSLSGNIGLKSKF